MAVDPFADMALEPAWHLVKPLSERARARVRAVYVLAPTTLNWSGDFSGPWMKKYRPLAEARLKEVLPDPELDKAVVSCREAGLGHAVKSLVRYAQREKAECIVIATHARSGLERVAMGSFAETVILTSSVPVLVINPAHKVPHQVRKILVPTDLSRKSEKFVAEMADYAKALQAEIILYHKQDDPLDPIVQQGVYSLGGGWVSMQTFIDAETEEKNKRLEKIEAIVRKRQVPVRHIFDASPQGLIDSIDKAAKDTGADMVSVLTQAGSWRAAILGSVARALVRRSSVPILVQR
jgi:nucleotide-binding universal stress UspA family protein